MFTNLRQMMATALLVAAVASQADAGWGRFGGGWGSSGGSSGGWGSSGGGWGSSGGWRSWGSSGGSWGSSGGYHRASYGSWGSSGGSSGGWGRYYGGSSGGYGYGSSGGYYSDHVVYDDGDEVDEHAPHPRKRDRDRDNDNDTNPPAPPAREGTAPDADAPSTTPSTEPAAPAEEPMTSTRRSGSALLTVRVPADARIYVNDLATSSVGTERQYLSRNLRRGARYNYQVRAEVVRNGKPVTETKSIKLAVGQNAELAFDFAAEAQTASGEAPATTLTVNVPAEAKVYLAGKETKSSGTIREFSTSKLQAGQTWNRYTVRAEINRDGTVISREQTITLKAGDSRNLSFDFNSSDVNQVANAVR